MATLCKIPISFGFTSNPNGTTPTYVSSSSGAFTGEVANLLEAPQSVAVTINARATGLPTTVYQSETGGATYTSLYTDNQGNVPGWVSPGSYTAIAAPSGGFAGLTVAFEAVRGDGVTNVAAGAVDVAQLTAAVLNALVPTGTILDYAGQTLPAGFVFGDNSVYPVGVSGSTYYNLSQVCGTTWNQGTEGSGNFRVPDLRGVALVGAGYNTRVTTASYALASLGGAETVALNGSQNGVHNHWGATGGGTSGNDYPDHSHNGAGTALNGGGAFYFNPPPGWGGVLAYAGPYWSGATISIGGAPGGGFTTGGANSRHAHSVPALSIPWDGGSTPSGGGSPGSSVAHQNMQPFVVTNKIIKL
jgi:microcystin-dependent protein